MRHLKLSLVTMACCLFFSSSVFAVSFGDPLLRSYLGQPLNVQVPISGVPASDLNASCIHATVKTINGEHLSTPRAEFVYPQFTAHEEQSGTATLVKFTTKEDIVEPAVTLSIALKCGPLMQRNYSLLLDYADLSAPATMIPADNNTGTAAAVPLATDLRDPASVRSTTASIKRNKRTKAASAPNTSTRAAQSVVKPKTRISARRAEKVSHPTDQLKISNEEISSRKANTASALENAPIDIEQQRREENRLTQERFAAMLRDDTTALAAPAVTPALTSAPQAANAKIDQQKIQRLESELAQLKLQIQRNNQPAEHPFPMSLIVMNVIALVLLVLLLLAVGVLWLKMRQHPGGHWRNAPPLNQQSTEAEKEERPAQTNA